MNKRDRMKKIYLKTEDGVQLHPLVRNKIDKATKYHLDQFIAGARVNPALIVTICETVFLNLLGGHYDKELD